jgi:hypothetical protein
MSAPAVEAFALDVLRHVRAEAGAVWVRADELAHLRARTRGRRPPVATVTEARNVRAALRRLARLGLAEVRHTPPDAGAPEPLQLLDWLTREVVTVDAPERLLWARLTTRRVPGPDPAAAELAALVAERVAGLAALPYPAVPAPLARARVDARVGGADGTA